MQCSTKNKELTNGAGCCSVPMWMGGMPAGFCDDPAYGERPPGQTWYNDAVKEVMRYDGKYAGYVPALACPGHGGPKKHEVLNLCDYCTNHIAECESNPEFGTGKGNDNVYACDSFNSKNT